MGSHAVSVDGESTAQWELWKPDFLGTARPLIDCARCGDRLEGGPRKPRHYMFTPTVHAVCDRCFGELPD